MSGPRGQTGAEREIKDVSDDVQSLADDLEAASQTQDQSTDSNPETKTNE